MSIRRKVPFEYSNSEAFQEKLVEWIGDMLYDTLPEHGYEVRDEQIFTAFQLADAVCDKKVHFSEAGLGTGKTFAYLLTAIPYARFTGKPVIIACATTALQEQLAGEDGDIRKLSDLLGLDVVARMAKDPNQYICDVRVAENTEGFGTLTEDIQEWLNTTHTGERSEIPSIPDHVWKKMKWEEGMDCEMCQDNGFCKLARARQEYRKSADLIVVDHATYFHDLWTRQERISTGQQTILPDYAAVIFDEGHKVLLPAAMMAGHQINREDVDNMIDSLEEIQGARDSMMSTVVKIEDATDTFFSVLHRCVMAGDNGQRLSVALTKPLLQAADTFRRRLDDILLEMQIEQELYTESLSANQIRSFEAQIEGSMWALNKFTKNKANDVIFWVDAQDGSFWVVPKNLDEMLKKHLYDKKIPVVFTSATLSNEGDFSYMARTLGISSPSSSTIGSPFELDKQVVVRILENCVQQTFADKVKSLTQLLQENGGRTLVLTNSIKEVKKIRKALKGQELPFTMLWEDKAERGYLVRTFRQQETSVLVGNDFWEGIDVPGDSLTMVVIWNLPFVQQDPLIEEQRKEAVAQGLNPVIAVDYPEMGLRLKQGCGRLIRKEDDHGMIVVMDEVRQQPWEKTVLGSLPAGAKVES